MYIPLVFGLGFWEIAIIVFVIILLFGAKKIPELMGGIGKGIKSFKEGVKNDDDKQKKISSGSEQKPDDQGYPLMD